MSPTLGFALVHLISLGASVHTAKCGPKVSRPITQTKTETFEAVVARGDALPSILLARPFDSGNVGSVARGMLNFGLWQLRLVAPVADHQSDEAVLRASGAAPLLRRAEAFEHMEAATSDLQLVLATTARPRESRMPVHSPREAVALTAAALRRGERVGWLFGSEKNGLSNDELEWAHGIVTIPTTPGFSSLNLAQAVLLLCYEWASLGDERSQLDVAKQAWESEVEAIDGSGARAPMRQVDSLFTWWEDRLWRSGFFGELLERPSTVAGGEGDGGGGKPRVDIKEDRAAEQQSARASSAMSKLRRLIMRAQPSKAEAALLRGALQVTAEPKVRGKRQAAEPRAEPK